MHPPSAKLTLATLVFAGFLGVQLHAEPSSRPNILFILADDLATRVGCYGDAAAITPNLDRLAAQGMVFEKAYVQGTVCTPSRTAFMLGLNNRNARRSHFIQHPDTMTMGRFFRQNGYQTFSVGKIDHTEEFVDPEAWDIRVKAEPKTSRGESLVAIRETVEKGEGRGRLVSSYGVVAKAEDGPDAIIADEAIRFLTDRRDRQRPFLAAVGLHKPHQPVVSTQAHFEAHADESRFTLAVTPEDASPIASGHLREEPGLNLTEAQQRLAQHAYYASASTMDEQLGRVLAALEREGLADSTLVVFTSDHGYHLGWRGQWAKHDLSEEVMRVPLIVRWPSVTQAGTRTNGIVELIDLFPTFAEAAGLPIHDTLDGESFVDQLRDPKAAGKAAAFCDDGPKGRTIRTARWRLTERLGGADELYDHSSDPGEFHNLFGTAGHEAITKRLAGQLVEKLGPRQLPRTQPKKKTSPAP